MSQEILPSKSTTFSSEEVAVQTTGASDATVKLADSPIAVSPDGGSNHPAPEIDTTDAPITLQGRSRANSNSKTGRRMSEAAEGGCFSGLWAWLGSLWRGLLACFGWRGSVEVKGNSQAEQIDSANGLHSDLDLEQPLVVEEQQEAESACDLQDLVYKINVDKLGDPERTDVPFGEIIQQVAGHPELRRLDFYENQQQVRELVEPGSLALEQLQGNLLDQFKTDLEQDCFSKNYDERGNGYGQLKPEEFQAWYLGYEAAINQLFDGIVEYYDEHAESGCLINPHTDQPFTADELQPFKARLKKLQKQMLSLVEGPYRFEIAKQPKQEWSDATDGILKDDGSPNFKSDHWKLPSRAQVDSSMPSAAPKTSGVIASLDPAEEDQGKININIYDLFHRSKLRIDESMLTEGLHAEQPGLLVLPGIQATLDGKPHDLIDLLCHERERLANLADRSRQQTTFTKNANSITRHCEWWNSRNTLWGKLDSLTDSLARMWRLLNEDESKGNHSKLDESRLSRYYPDIHRIDQQQRQLLYDYIELRNYHSTFGIANRIRKLPLEYIFEICRAWNTLERLYSTPSYRDNPPGILRMPYRSFFFPFEEFCAQIMPDTRSGAISRGVFTCDAGAITYDCKKYDRMKPDDFVGPYDPMNMANHEQASMFRERLLEFQELCQTDQSFAALFRSTNRDRPYYHVQVFLKYPKAATLSEAAQRLDWLEQVRQAALGLRETLEKQSPKSELRISINGQLGVTTEQFELLEQSHQPDAQPGPNRVATFNKHFFQSMELPSAESWHPQMSHSARGAAQPSFVGTQISYIDRNDSMDLIMPNEDVDGNIKPEMRFRRSGINDDEYEFEKERSFMFSAPVHLNIHHAESGKALTKTVDFNPQIPYSPRPGHRFPQQVPHRFNKHLTINGVMISKLMGECHERAFSAYNRKRERALNNQNDVATLDA